MQPVPLQEIEVTFVKLVDDEDSSTGSNSTADVSFCDNCRISCMKTRQMNFIAVLPLLVLQLLY